MKSILGIDIETYSPVPLPKTGVYRYVDTDDFEILLFSYAVEMNSGILPILVAYPIFQRYFVKGITLGAVKE